MRLLSLPLLILALMQPQRWSVSEAAPIHVTLSSSGSCRLEQLPSVRVVTCSGSDVTEVPTVAAGIDVSSFFLDPCPISDIKANSFANLTGSLKYLSINSTVQINSISGDAFKNLGSLVSLSVIALDLGTRANLGDLLQSLTSLTFLHVEKVRLGSLPSEFAASTKLATLKLIKTDIVSVDPNAFSRLTSLSVLDMSANIASTYVNDLLRQIITVETLSLTGCQLTTVRATANSTRLRKIRMDKNILNQVDLRNLAGISETLEELNLNINQLSETGIPGLETLTALRRLYLSSNPELKQIPTNLGQLEGLEILDVRITSIGNIRVGDFHERSRLTSLKLDDTQVNLIELTAFQRLSQLAELSLNLPASQVLFRSVADKQLASWSDVFSRLPALRNLTLSGTSGAHSSLDDSIWPGLASCQQLRRLVLEYNAITTVPDFQFALTRLERLSLRGNFIASLNSASLYGLAPNAQLILLENKLTTLDNCSLAGLTSLAGVDLAGNMWRCDCNLVWLLERLRSDVGDDALKTITCDKPDSLRGRAWFDLTVADFCPRGSAVAAAVCEVRQPPTTQSPTPTAFPYPLDIRLSMEPGTEQLLVRMVLNASGFASRFDHYSVRYGLEREYDFSSRSQEASISVGSLTFHLDVNEIHKFCVSLRKAGWPEGNVESPDNCRTFLPTRPEPQITGAHISAAVVAPIVGLGLLGVFIYCLVSRRIKQKEIEAAMARHTTVDDDENKYDLYPDDPGNPHFISRKSESRRFTKRSGSNTMTGSRPSLATSSSNLQQQLQLQQMQQMQQMQQRMHSMSMGATGRQSDPFSASLGSNTQPWDARAAMRAARSTDQLSSNTNAFPASPSRARSQEFGIDHPMLQRSRSGFNQYPVADDDAPPPLPARNPSRLIPQQPEPEEEYERMDV